MLKDIPVALVNYDTEQRIAVIGGPLYIGYREYIEHQEDHCRTIIAAFLASVYATITRKEERSTEQYVREIYHERGLSMPPDKLIADHEIVMAAAERRYDRLHLPVLKSILFYGYEPSFGPPITMAGKAGRYLVSDGKNRCSILAAMGRETVPNVRVV